MKAAVWARVSTDSQDEGNQLPDLERFCAHHGHEIVKRYIVHGASAYKGEQAAMLKQVLDDAYRGEFEILVIWAIDRIERRGIERVLRLIRELRERNVSLASVQQTWLNGSEATTELLVAMFGWMAQHESQLKSERIRAGLKRRRKDIEAGRVQGAMGGRKPGSKNRHERPDKGQPSRTWTPERAEALAARNRARTAKPAA